MANDLNDPLALSELFTGGGEPWAPLLRPTLESLDGAGTFIGAGRDKNIVPVRELTFQALKPNPPERWKVVVFGQNPYPRVESATGIAMFDNAFDDWSNGKFGSVTSIRCIIKAACIWKYGVPKATSVAEIRQRLASDGVVKPPEWFQAMLTQGVLLLNAALTASSDGALTTAQHTAFWRPVIEKAVEGILRAKEQAQDPADKGVVFAWWGAHAKALRKVVQKLEKQFPTVRVAHLDHCNPAAMGDAFCDGNHFADVNAALKSLGAQEIDWLPDRTWKQRQAEQGHAARMGEFIAETMELHKKFLERLQDAAEEKLEELPAIDGLWATPLMSFPEATRPLASVLPGAEHPLQRAMEHARKTAGLFGSLSEHEFAAVYLYTMESHVYRRLNATLRDPDRARVRPYLPYLRLFFSAMSRLSAAPQSLWRGVAADLRHQYPQGSTITWWGVSSCTPNPAVARGFLGSKGRRMLFEVHASTAVSIRKYSAFDREDEYVLAPGTRLHVERIRADPDGLTQVTLRELPEERRVS